MRPTTATDAAPGASIAAGGATDVAAPLFIVLNCGSGSNDAAVVRKTLDEILSAAGREYHIHVVAEPRQLPAVARQAVGLAASRGGIVVAAGGDGTINAVVQEALGNNCAIGVLPLGTFNYLGRTWQIPEDAAQAARLLLRARATPVQVGLVNDRVFVVNASIGLYPRLLEERESLKRQYGRSRAVALWAAIVTLLREHRQLRLIIEHEGESRTVRTPTLFVSNNRLQLEQIGIPEASELERGQLVAITPRVAGTTALLWLMLRSLFGRLGQASDVTSFSFERITVKRMDRWHRRRVRVSTDGELGWLEAPLEFRVAPERLLLLVPDDQAANEAPA